MTNTAYDSILEYSSAKQFGDFRRVLIGNRGTIASGNLAKGMHLVFDKNKSTENESFFTEANNSNKTPINIAQRLGRYSQPGLIFNKIGYDEVRRQIETRGELTLTSIFDKLQFEKDSDARIWESSNETTKKRCVSNNLSKLYKETQSQYRTHGDRMHYLTLGMVEVETLQGDFERYPLFLFSCPELDVKKLKAQIDISGFINFWLDKNIFDNEIGVKRQNNFEVTLDSEFAIEVNTITQYMNNINLSAKYKNINVNPTYMAFQIITGFEAEYVDPAWSSILREGEI